MATDPIDSEDVEDEPTIDLVTTPASIPVALVCPACGQVEIVAARIQTRQIRDQEGNGNALALRTKAAKVAHTCGQMALGLVEGARER